jgi:hypothetical protein
MEGADETWEAVVGWRVLDQHRQIMNWDNVVFGFAHGLRHRHAHGDTKAAWLAQGRVRSSHEQADMRIRANYR